MTQIELRTKEVICAYLPQIAKELHRMNDILDRKICCLCGKEIDGYGNNPYPLAENGICCDECNEKVIIARMKGVK